MKRSKAGRITLHACGEMPKYIDALAEKFGISQEKAANELLLALTACASELSEVGPLREQPLKVITEALEEVSAALKAVRRPDRKDPAIPRHSGSGRYKSRRSA